MLKKIARRLTYNFFFIGIYRLMRSNYRRYQEESYRKKYDIDPDFKFNGREIAFYGDGEITCGADSYIGKYAHVQAREGFQVSIGQNSALSHHIMIYTENRIADQDLSTEQVKSGGDVIIGDDCWIGAYTFITEGSRIGNNAVIGANSTVTKSIPPDAIAAGSPAKVVKFKSYLSDSETAERATTHWDSLHADLQEELLDTETVARQDIE